MKPNRADIRIERLFKSVFPCIQTYAAMSFRSRPIERRLQRILMSLRAADVIGHFFKVRTPNSSHASRRPEGGGHGTLAVEHIN
jgi:hypothetical protein